MIEVVISGTGIATPKEGISNEELVAAFNAHVEDYNEQHAAEIEAGTIEAKSPSSAAFIEKASGIKHRYVVDKAGLMDKDILAQRVGPEVHGDDETPSYQAALALESCQMAMDQAGLNGDDIDYLVCAISAPQRMFPSIGVEIQHHLGIKGTAMDMMMACSSATFGIINCIEAIQSGRAKRAIMVNPETFTTMVNFRDRDSHFIFGDLSCAVIIERADIAKGKEQWKVFDTKTVTQYSNNIRSNFGPFSRMEDGNPVHRDDMYFVQKGRKVFKELLPLVTNFLSEQINDNQLSVDDLSRMWLHQANVNMNMFAAKKLLGRDPTPEEAPIVLSEYGNTAGAGSVVAFHKHREDLKKGDKGVICSFGAGYSIGSLLIEKL